MELFDVSQLHPAPVCKKHIDTNTEFFILCRILKQYMNDQVCSEIPRHRHGFSDAGREPNRREGAMKEWALTTAVFSPL